jgi:hypothetical protein
LKSFIINPTKTKRERKYMNKTALLLLTSSFFITVASANENSAGINKFKVEFADTSWNGSKVPIGQQCLKFGGKDPLTPRFKVSDIPVGATAILMEYSDRAYKPNDNGGHGKLGYQIAPDTKNIIIPSVQGHTFELPPAFFSVAMHRAPDWDKAGAYLPPCSGGNKHPYYVTVKAVKKEGSDFTVLAQELVEMGFY